MGQSDIEPSAEPRDSVMRVDETMDQELASNLEPLGEIDLETGKFYRGTTSKPNSP